jgi:hypothetical protein
MKRGVIGHKVEKKKTFREKLDKIDKKEYDIEEELKKHNMK